MGTSWAVLGGIVPRDVIFTGTLKLPGDQDLALRHLSDSTYCDLLAP